METGQYRGLQYFCRLNEFPKESKFDEEYFPPPIPPPRISIRNKIGSRITAAKEKRRREEIEKNATKERKRESKEKIEKVCAFESDVISFITLK